MSILEEIYTHKRGEVTAAQCERPAAMLEAAIAKMPAPPGLAAALRGLPSTNNSGCKATGTNTRISPSDDGTKIRMLFMPGISQSHDVDYAKDEIASHDEALLRSTLAMADQKRIEAGKSQEGNIPIGGSDTAPVCEGYPKPRLIAEVKFRSPSKGILRSTYDPLELARTYAEKGAAAISVLTDEKYFGGSLGVLEDIANLDLGLPLLRKDFIFDRYQLLEARAAGASAALLIVAMLTPGQLCSLLAEAHSLGLEALVEAHCAAEVERALEAGARIVGVNNRDLHTFEVSLDTCLQLRKQIPAEVVMVAESGIRNPADVARLEAAGVDAMLIGEALVTAEDVGARVREFV